MENIRGQRVYVDANIFIYLFEGCDALKPQIKAFQTLLSENACELFSSALVFTEILPPLAKAEQTEAMERIIEFFDNSKIVTLLPMSEVICIQAGVLRGAMAMKTPDALHVATAIDAECDVFLTNDTRIRLPANMKRVIFSEIV